MTPVRAEHAGAARAANVVVRGAILPGITLLPSRRKSRLVAARQRVALVTSRSLVTGGHGVAIPRHRLTLAGTCHPAVGEPAVHSAVVSIAGRRAAIRSGTVRTAARHRGAAVRAACLTWAVLNLTVDRRVTLRAACRILRRQHWQLTAVAVLPRTRLTIASRENRELAAVGRLPTTRLTRAIGQGRELTAVARLRRTWLTGSLMRQTSLDCAIRRPVTVLHLIVPATTVLSTAAGLAIAGMLLPAAAQAVLDARRRAGRVRGVMSPAAEPAGPSASRATGAAW